MFHRLSIAKLVASERSTSCAWFEKAVLDTLQVRTAPNCNVKGKINGQPTS